MTDFLEAACVVFLGAFAALLTGITLVSAAGLVP